MKLLSADDFAGRLALPIGKFWALWRERKIAVQAVRIGNGYIRWKEADVDRWLEQLEQTEYGTESD
jgi:hypothetical protein